ncbi:MAG: EF-hand domain-containing protein [Pseudomonadaceae bacterium]|nr:EF-hand domain-containing protein [Pseudomonadaceae bacterium]
MNQTSKQISKKRRLKKAAAWGIVPVGVVISALALAAPGQDRFPISIAEVESKTAERFAKIDTDKSGSVDMTEFEQARPSRDQKQGAHRARHADGRKSGHSMKGRQGGERHAQRQALREAAGDEMFALMDTDGDGVISQEEHNSADSRKNRALAHKRAMFKQLDKDQDALLTLEEMPNPAERLRQVDTDNDGIVTRAEMHAARALRRSNAQVEAG